MIVNCNFFCVNERIIFFEHCNKWILKDWEQMIKYSVTMNNQMFLDLWIVWKKFKKHDVPGIVLKLLDIL